MRVLLVSANTERSAIIPLPLGPAFVAAACRRAGHETALLDLMSERHAMPALHQRIQEFRPGVIGISVRNIDDQNMASPKFLLPAVREVVTVCRKLCRAPIVLGGPGYSMFPESVLRFLQADMGIRGEGEIVFPALLERLESGSDPYGLPGVYLPGHPPAGVNFSTSLEDLPLPEPELWLPAEPHRRDFCPSRGSAAVPWAAVSAPPG